MQYLTNVNIFCSNQNGFRKNYSTALAPIDLHDKISTVFDRGEFAVGISPDLSKAFDTVNHAILFYKTEHYDIENVEDFQYLGSYIPSTGKDIKCRKGRAWSAFWKLDRVWKSPASLQQKVQLFKASALIVLLYGCKSWVLTSDCQLDSFQTSCLGIIFGVPRTDHVSNEEVYDRTGTVPLSQLVKAPLDQIPGPLSSAHPGGH